MKDNSDYKISDKKSSDISRIKNQISSGKNEALHSTSYGKRENTIPKNNELEKKDKLEKKDELDEESDKKENKKSSKSSSKKSLGSLARDKLFGKTNNPISKFKAFVLKAKIALIVIGVFVTLFVILFIFSAFASMYDSLLGALSLFFGVAEKETSEGANDGLLVYDDYLYDDDGNSYNLEGLVNYLNDDSECSSENATFLDNISDTFSQMLSDSYDNVCSYTRYIDKYSDETEEKYDGLKIDRGLILATVFYGYSYQGDNTDSSEHYKTLIDNIEDGKIKVSDVKKIIDNSYSVYNKAYYKWVVEDKTGKCVKYYKKTAMYDSKKWKIFMRFGENESNKYEKINIETSAYSSSDEECKGNVSDNELLERIKNVYPNESVSIDSSVYTARSVLSSYASSTQSTYTEEYADIDSTTEDTFSDGKSYLNGEAYKLFPEIAEDNEGKYLSKMLEKMIEEIFEKKKTYNSIINEEDQDGGFGSSNGSLSVATGANCTPYLTASLDEITVELSDCNGQYIASTTFEDYIIGVANAEVSYHDSAGTSVADNYVLSEMTAAISYALARRNNYSKGKTIYMRSGTCDQAYCSMMKGCWSQRNPNVCSGCSSFYIGGSRANPSLYSKYQELYAQASQFLVIKDEKVYSAHYVSTIQNGWFNKAKQGMNFTQIIQEEYEDEGANLIGCQTEDKTAENNAQSTLSSSSTSTTTSTSSAGTTSSSEYPNTAESKGKFTGFAYKDVNTSDISIDPDWTKENITTIYSNCGTVKWNQAYEVNIKAKDNFTKAFSNICSIIKNGVTLSNGKKCKYTASTLLGNSSDGVVFTQTKGNNNLPGLHAYGISQDWNYKSSITINNVTYNPYSLSSTREDYNKFVQALGGTEESCENVNYILYKYAYQEAGFTWLGLETGKSYNGMTFQLNY